MRLLTVLCFVIAPVFAGEELNYGGVRVLRDEDFTGLPDSLTVDQMVERFGMPSGTAIVGIGCYLRFSPAIDYANDSYGKVWESYYFVSSKEHTITAVITSEGKLIWPRNLRELQAKEDREKKAAEPGATDNPDDAQRIREDH